MINAGMTSARRPLTIGFAVTAAAAASSAIAPAEYAATVVALVFAGATYWFVLRGDAATIEAHGLALGGLLSPTPLMAPKIARDTARALGWALFACAVTLPPFWIGYLLWFSVDTPFQGSLPAEFWDAALGHLLVVALPEEMFYRGVLQTQLDRAWPPKYRLWGAQLGWGLLVSSAIFALGHLLTTPHPSRLAVFFPSLLFGWLRSRTGGIGAGVIYHAACNVFSSYLAAGYR
jgi:hypothetical protein